MDDTFGGVIIGVPEPQVIVAISTRPGPPGRSGFSGYSGGGGGGGGSGFAQSGFSGKSGYSGASGKSGFSGFSGRSGFSGYSGVGQSGFSGFSGASGASGPGGGNSGYSGYSGQDGTFSGSGFSGYSGFSSKSGFSGYSGSGISGYSAYSGFSGTGPSGFSGFSGPGASGFSGFSSPSGFSGFSGKSGYSGYSGFSGTGSPPGGSPFALQYNVGGVSFGGLSTLGTDVSENIFANSNRFFLVDPGDPTKQVHIDANPLAPGASVSVKVGANSTTVIPNPGTPGQFVTGIGASGAVPTAQPTFSAIGGLVTYGQLDRSTSVVIEAATITIAANTKVKSTASGTLTTIAFSGGNSAAQGRRLDLDITGGPYTLTIPACRRIGETGTITTLQVFAGYNEFSWEFINGEYVMSDSVSDPSGGGGGSSGYSGYSGKSGFSGTSTSGFSGFSGNAGPSGGTGTAGSSGFSGFSSPSLLPFTTHNDTDWTLTLADAQTGIKMASSSAHSVIIPPNSVVAFPLGTQIVIEQFGSALVSISPGIGVTLQGATLTEGLYSMVVLIKQATDTWLAARSGASGYSGYSGGPGLSGFSGFSGTGPSGFSGYSGGSGYSGYSSFSGFSGKSGFSSFSGYSGFSAASPGPSGYSGYSGFSGFSGYSSFSGFSAFSGFSGNGGWVKLSVTGADVTTTNSALTDITGLVSGTLAASTKYEIRALLFVATSADTTGIRYGIGAGGSGASALCNALISGTVQTNTGTTGTIDQPNSVSGVFMTTASESGTIEIRGSVVTRSVAPTISLMHGKVVPSGTSTVKVGSYLEYRLADV